MRFAWLLLALPLATACSKSGAGDAKSTTKPPPPVVASSANDPDASPFQDTAPTAVTPGQSLAIMCDTPKGTKARCIDIVVDTPSELAVGAPATIGIDAKAVAPYHLNVLPDKELGLDPYEWYVMLQPVAGIDAPKHVTDLAHAVKKAEEETSFQLAFTAKDAGKKEMHAAVLYAACIKGRECVPGVVHLVWNVAVK